MLLIPCFMVSMTGSPKGLDTTSQLQAGRISTGVMEHDPATINWNKFFVETLPSEQGKYTVNYCFELMDEYR